MLTAPYMHDGRFVTIEQVLDHYSKDVKSSSTLDRLRKQDSGRQGIPLTEQEKQSVIAFLNSLTDPSFTNNPKLSKPD